MNPLYLLPLLIASALAGTTGFFPVPLTYSNLDFFGDTFGGSYVHRMPVQGLSRTSFKYTPQYTEVRPQIRIQEKVINVPVPKPVYRTQAVTPVHTQYVPEPIPVAQPYAVPYAVPVGVSHEVVTAVQPEAPVVQQYMALQTPAFQQVAAPVTFAQSPIAPQAVISPTFTGFEKGMPGHTPADTARLDS